MTDHPDIVEMSARYERMAETPTAQATDGLIVLAGLFVTLAPWIVGFTEFGQLTMNNLVVGIGVTLLGMGFAYAYERTHRLAWVCPMLGAWTIVSVWLVDGADATKETVLSNAIGGGMVALLGLITVAPMVMSRRAGRR